MSSTASVDTLNVLTVAGRGTAVSYGRTAKSLPDTDYTLNVATEANNRFLDLSGTLTAGRNVIAPLIAGVEYIVKNATGQTLTIKGGSGTGVAIATGKIAIVICDGTNYVSVTPDH